MRIFVVTTVLLVLPALASAQSESSDSGLRGSRGRHVALIDADSREWQGRLLEVAHDAVVLEIASEARRFELSAVKRVDAHGEGVWDGAARGAIVGGLLATLTIGNARVALQNALFWGFLGAGIDALNHCTHTVYRAPARKAAITISW